MAQTDPLITADMTSEAAFAAIVESSIIDIDRHLAEFMETPSLDGPHGARVSLRRLTTAFDAFEALMKRTEAKALRREAKAIFRRLGEVRDADVYLALHAAAKDVDSLTREVAALRQSTRDALRAEDALTFGPRLHRRLADGSLFRTGPPGLAARSEPVARRAVRALDDAFGLCLAQGRNVGRMRATTRHEFRKDMKTLRYLTEFFAALWPASEAAERLDALQALQDDLGLLNDLANARRRSGRPRRRSKAERRALERAEEHWGALRKSGRWWRHSPLAPPPVAAPIAPPAPVGLDEAVDD